MKVVDTTQINSFAPIAAQTNFVQPSEEAVFILTSGQLQEIISQAVQKTIEPLQDRIEDLEKMVVAQDKQIATLTSTQEREVNRICLDIAYDRQRLARLEKVEPQPLQRDRGEILCALLTTNGGKMLATDARKKMRLSRPLFTALLATVRDEIDARPYHLNKSWKVLVLR